jgi:hypothetical protein
MRFSLTPMSPQAFACFALSEVACVKSVKVARETSYEIRPVGGSYLGPARDRATALAAVRPQDMVPLSLQ